MPASSSIAVESGRLAQPGQSSVMKMATPKLSGTPTTMAMTEVMTVP
ncbi:MAG: hypothetical protein WDN69_24080 [Aliidongia sp.]